MQDANRGLWVTNLQRTVRSVVREITINLRFSPHGGFSHTCDMTVNVGRILDMLWIISWAREEIFHIYKQPCIFLYFMYRLIIISSFSAARNLKSLNLIGKSRALQRQSEFSHTDPELLTAPKFCSQNRQSFICFSLIDD